MNKRARLGKVARAVEPKSEDKIIVNILWDDFIEVDGERLTFEEYKRRYPQTIFVDINKVFGSAENGEDENDR